MRIAVIGGTGLIGTKVVDRLRAAGHETVVAARATGVDAYTGEGLTAALTGADAVIDASNSSYVDEAAAREYFYAATLNLLTYGSALDIPHHIALSVVGTDRLARAQGGYFIAKAEQERLITTSGRPFSLVHGTQFFEFVRSITDTALHDGGGHVADVLIRPIAADDVADAVVQTAIGQPTGGMNEVTGPDIFELGELARLDLRRRKDEREVTADPLATYFGARLSRTDLLPGPEATVAPTHFRAWLDDYAPRESP